MPITGSANIAAVDIPALAKEELALLYRSRVDDGADEGVVNNGALGNKESGDVGPAVGGGGTYGPIEDGAGAGSSSLMERNGMVVA